MVGVSESGSSGSPGVEETITYLNKKESGTFLQAMAMTDKALSEEMSRANMWTGGSFVVQSAMVTGIVREGLKMVVECNFKGKPQKREILLPFPKPVNDEKSLKIVLISMACAIGRRGEAGQIASLSFGDTYTVPKDFRFNDVPHAAWVRSYVYASAAEALALALEDPTMTTKSRMQIKINIPEMNPAFDTYRIGTMLELVREMALSQVYLGKRVRVCVQQSLGEGVFQGLPLSLASMRPAMERMDWGRRLTDSEKAKMSDTTGSRPEALIRFGAVGPDQIAEDDDLVIVIAPQNVIGASLMDLLEAMVKKANGKPLVLVNPQLADRPSSNNVMQIRGRSERRAFADSFQDIFVMRLLYPSSGGYMFPIRGMVGKMSYSSPYVVYYKRDSDDATEERKGGQEEYKIIAAFPSQPTPDQTAVSEIFTRGLGA